MSYKLKILNGVLKLKTFSDVVLNILGIKDLGTQTGNVTDGYVDWSMQQVTKTTAQWNASSYVLLKGQVGVEDNGTTVFPIKVGNGVNTWSQLGYQAGGGGGSATWGSITGTLSSQTDLQNALNLRVPYSGATQDVDLGANGLNAKFLSVKGNSGTGHLGLKHQSVDSTAGGQETVLFAGSDGELYYKNDGNSVVQVASRTWVTTQLIANYTQSFYFPSFSPADATNYYVGNCNNTPFTTDTNVRLMALKTGSLKKVAFTSRQTAGSSENSTFALGINGSYTNIATTVKFDGSPNNNNLITGLNIAVTESDILTLRWTTPTWVTNPTGVAAIITLYFE